MTYEVMTDIKVKHLYGKKHAGINNIDYLPTNINIFIFGFFNFCIL